MSAITTRLGLDVYDDIDDPTVKTWRDTINKNAVSSAFSKIDAYAISTDSRIDDLELARMLFRIYGSFSTENNYVATSSDIGTLANGIQIQLSVDISNTNSAVLNINSGGNKTLQKLSPLGVATNLTVGDLIANKIYTFEYQNGVWIMMGGVTSNQVVVSDSTAGNLLMVSNDKTIDESGVSLYNSKIASEGINIGSMLGVDGSHNLILPTMSLTPGTYIGVTIDAYGRVSGITTPNPLATGNFVFRANDGILSWASYAPDSEKLGGNLPSYYLPATSKAVDSDLLDGLDSLAFATSTHNHDSIYLGVAAKAADSILFDGFNTDYFATSTHGHDHGALSGLSDNDHPQYRLAATAIDHGALTGLADNDHPQYVLASAIGQWASYTPIWTASTTNPVLGNGTLIGRYCVVGKLCTMAVKLIIGSTTTPGDGNWAFSIPLPMIAGNDTAPNYIGTANCRKSGTTTYVLAVYLAPVFSTTKTTHFVQDGTSNLNLTPTTPFAWATGDSLTFEITYELA